MATLKDVAQLAGVSTTTVSVIVNGKAKERQLSQKTIEKVTAAIRTLNYQPSISARSLRSTDAQAFTVGIFWVSDYRSTFLSRFINGIQKQKMQSDIKMNIVICPYKSDEICNESALYQMNAYNAVIIANASEKDMAFIHENPIPIPTVLSNRQSELYHTVSIDNFELGRKAARHLIERGVNSVGVISMGSENYAMNRSTQGFLEVCRENHLEPKPEHLISTGLSMDEGYQAGENLIKSKALPQAIFCDNDSCAIGLVRAFNDHHIKIPDDVQVIAVGLGSSNYTKYANPGITIVDVPLETMAEKCLEVVELIGKHLVNTNQHITFDSVLHQRASTVTLTAIPTSKALPS